MIKPTLDRVMQRIPVVWPLQQFVAVNPLEDLSHMPFDHAVGEMSQLLGEKLSLPLQKLMMQYDQKNMDAGDIFNAVNDIIVQKNDQYSLTDIEVSITVDLLKGFLLNGSWRHQVFQLISQTSCSSQVDDGIRTMCLSWITQYVSQSKNLHDKTGLSSSLFQMWRSLMIKKNKKWHNILHDSPEDACEFVEHILSMCHFNEDQLENCLFNIVWQMKGWAGYIKWQKKYPNNPWANCQMDVIELVAIWLGYKTYEEHQAGVSTDDYANTMIYDDVSAHLDNSINESWLNYVKSITRTLSNHSAEFINAVSQKIPMSLHLYFLFWQRASEVQYEQSLMHNLTVNQQQDNSTHEKSIAQWVFCLDVRSEGVRRHLEKIASYRTYGFAGFFGFAFTLNQNNERLSCHCPALIDPEKIVAIQKSQGDFLKTNQASLLKTVQQVKSSFLSAFTLFEMVGLFSVFKLLYKNYFPMSVSRANQLDPNQVALTGKSIIEKMGMEYVVAQAKSLLMALALGDRYDEFVIICGHSAQTENNPFHASLDCGACGGNAGSVNAVLVCAVLNDQNVRVALRNEQVFIPDSTIFIAANHNTTTDAIQWYDSVLDLNDHQQKKIKQIKDDAQLASNALRNERLAKLPGDSNVERRSKHWAELLPELGLVNNAAMVIGPRALTVNLNLEQRVFLHSYEASADPDLSILQSILLGPLMVAYWINMQYYFSTVAPEIYSAGNKAIHNVIEDVGVLEGNDMDLKGGLPLQSVYFRETPLHQPMRLLVVVYAKQDAVAGIVSSNKKLSQLVQGGWIRLNVIEPSAQPTMPLQNNTDVVGLKDQRAVELA